MPQIIRAQIVTTLVGTAGASGTSDGVGAAARFNGPNNLCSDGAGNLFVADQNNHTIRRIVIATGTVTTFAGTAGMAGFANGTGTAARFTNPIDLCIDGAGNLFVADENNHVIRRIVIATGVVTTIAGTAGMTGSADGTGAAARFDNPRGICSDGAGNLFVTDRDNHTIRRIDIATGAVTTVAGTAGMAGSADGSGAGARFNLPLNICSDGAGNLFVTDFGNHTVRRVVIATGAVTTFAGTAGMTGSADGTGAAVRFNTPRGICSDGDGNLFVSDFNNHTIRRIDIATGAVTTFVGTAGMLGTADGTGAAARFNRPTGSCSDGAGNLFVADHFSHTIRRVAPVFQGITSFTPTSGSAGTTVIITGVGFAGATAVSIGGIPVAGFTVNSNRQITAVLGSGTPGTGGSQLVVVTAPAGTFSLGGFFVGAVGGTPSSGIPTTFGTRTAIIGTVSPSIVTFGTPITVSGVDFTGATGLLIGGVAVSNFNVLNDNTITAVVGGVPVNDRVILTGGLGANLDMSGLGIVYNRLPAPVVTVLSPASIAATGNNEFVGITGRNFLAGIRAQISDGRAGQDVSVQNVSAGALTLIIPGSLQSVGTKMITLFNPDGQTVTTTFTVTLGAPVRLNLESLEFSTTASGNAFMVRLRGANIFPSATVQLDGVNTPLRILSSTEATVEIPASLNSTGGVNIVIRLRNTDGQSTAATVRIARRSPPTIQSVRLFGDGRLQVRGLNFMGGISALLGNTTLTILSQEELRQEGETAFTAQIPANFRAPSNSPTLTLIVRNSDEQAHGVILPRTMFEAQFGTFSASGGTIFAEQTWTASEKGGAMELTERLETSTDAAPGIYPNPVESELRIGGRGLRMVKVYDARGAVVLESSTESGLVDVRRLIAGVYTVQVEYGAGRLVQSIIKR